MRVKRDGRITKDVFGHECMSWVKFIPKSKPESCSELPGIVTEKAHFGAELPILCTPAKFKIELCIIRIIYMTKTLCLMTTSIFNGTLGFLSFIYNRFNNVLL